MGATLCEDQGQRLHDVALVYVSSGLDVPDLDLM